MVNSRHIKCRLILDELGQHEKRIIALYVPLSYPVKPINGCMVSDFLTPSIDSDCAYPESLKLKLKEMKNPEIFFDVAVGLAGHKGLDINALIEKTYKMTEMQISLLKDLLVNEEWDFFMAVMIGTDRLQHMLWNHFDETHRRFVKDSAYRNSLRDYYSYLDRKLGEIIELLDEDTIIIVASDHGMIKQEGKININNWLAKEGYLVLKGNPEKRRFSPDLVDMEKSAAYGSGAYNGRIYINRKKLGKRYEKVRKEITEKLKNIPDDKGNRLDTKVYRTDEIYKDSSHPECPDLIVYFDDLKWASNPDLGQEGIYSWHTFAGADSAGHSRQGCFIINGPKIKKKGKISDVDIRQVAPTILKLLDIRIPSEIKASPVEVF